MIFLRVVSRVVRGFYIKSRTAQALPKQPDHPRRRTNQKKTVRPVNCLPLAGMSQAMYQYFPASAKKTAGIPSCELYGICRDLAGNVPGIPRPGPMVEARAILLKKQKIFTIIF